MKRLLILPNSVDYVSGLNGLISQTDGSGNQTYFLHDGLDSIRELINSSGTGVSDYYYDAFGADRGSTWSQRSTTTEYTFNGQQDEPTLGLYYLRARYYDPYTGRLLSKDPVRATCGTCAHGATKRRGLPGRPSGSGTNRLQILRVT